MDTDKKTASTDADTFVPTPTPVTDDMRNELAFMAEALEDRAEGHLGDRDTNADRAMLLRVIGMTTKVQSLETSAAFLTEELVRARAEEKAAQVDGAGADRAKSGRASVVVPMKRRAGKAVSR